MELRLLRAFVTVAEHGSISQAAIALGLTQSSLSRIISALEAEVGSTLFHRTGRGVVLSATGEAALPRARRIVIEANQFSSDLRDADLAPGGTVTVALLPSIIRDVAGALFEAVRQSNPRITLRLLEGFSGRVEEWLADGRADIGVMSRYRRSHARHEEVISTSHLMLIGAPSRTRERDTVRLRELATLPLVLPAHPNGMRVALDNVSRRLRISLPVIAEADSIEAQKAIVRRGGCYTILSRATATHELDSGELHARTIIEPRIPRFLVISVSTHHPLAAPVRQVLGLLRRLEHFR